MKIQRRIFRRKSAALFLIAAVCSLGASAVHGSGGFAPLPPGSLQFHFAPITWASIATSTPARSKSQPATIPKTALVSRKAAPTTLPGEVLGASISPTDTVTHAELTSALDELSNSLKQIVYANLSAPNSLPATGGYTNSIALSNRIDQLSGTKLSNITVSGVAGLTAADIPTNIVAGNYLPLAGGALTGDLTGTDLTLTGNLTVAGAQTLSGAITVPYLVATSTTAVSSLQQLLANGSTTLQNFTFVNATGTAATTTALFAAVGHFTTGIIDTLTSALANFGTITATNATITNSTTTNEYSSNLAAAAARFGATATSSFSSAGALSLASPLAVSSGGTGSTTLSGILKGAGTSQVATAIAGTDYQAPLSFSYPIQNSSNVASLAFGTTTANTWSSLQTLASGLLSLASSTIGSGAQAGGLTISGGATTTGNAYFAGNVGIGTTSSYAKFSVKGSGVSTGVNFQTTDSNDSPLVSVLDNGSLLVGSSTSISQLVINNSLNTFGNKNTVKFTNKTGQAAGQDSFAFYTTPSSAVGGYKLINLYDDTNTSRFSVDNNGVAAAATLTTTGGSLTNSANSTFNITSAFGGGSGPVFVFNGNGGVHTTAFKFQDNSTNLVTLLGNGNVGIGTTTPWRTLSVTGTVGFDGLTNGFGAGSLCLTANREVVYNAGSDNCLSSLRATKHDINPLTVTATSTIVALSPVSFVYNDDASSTVRYGFIAEDTAAVDQHLATYDQSGALTGVDDRAVLSIIVKALQELIATVSGFAQNFATQTLVADNGTFQKVSTQELCVGSTCVTPAQFQAIVSGAGQSSSATSANLQPAPTTPIASISPDTAPSAATTTADAPSIVPDYNATTTLPDVPAATTSPIVSPTVEQATSTAQ